MTSSQQLADSLTDFAEELSAEGDRAAVILGAAKVDDLLLAMLSAFLLPPLGKDEDLLEGDRPLSTLSARITACHRLALLDKRLAQSLHLLRKIRNDFAHKIAARLDDGAIRDRARSFVSSVASISYFAEVRSVFFSDSTGLEVDFRVALSTVVIRLHKLLTKVRPIESSRDIQDENSES